MANQQHVEILKRGVAVWNQWRKDHPETRPDLVEAAFPGMDLSEANFALTNLYRTDFSNTRLMEAEFDNAYASWAIFRGADLTEAGLRFTNLVEADLEGANLTRAYMWGTVLSGNDLRNVTGLDTVDHTGPSYIGVDTLYRSQGEIPELFMRSCGVPEVIVTYAKSLVDNPIQFYSCFISYSQKDQSFARRLHNDLQAKGIRCWLDEKAILPGDDIYEEVDRGIRLWDKILFCASQNSLGSWWVEREIDRAFKKEMEIKKARNESVLAIIPLDLDGSFLKWNHPHAAALQKRLAADFTGWESDSKKLTSSLKDSRRH